VKRSESRRRVLVGEIACGGLTELCEVTRDNEVKQSVEEVLQINATYFFPKAAGRSCLHRQPSWNEVTDPRSSRLSYGHNVEFAWLMIRAQKVLGTPLAWDQRI
jgi:mannose/cellobiose epimerase-like protein (N-acyl-D-glucosamine 2-epimerase family)